MPAPDAIVVDASGMSVEEVVTLMAQRVSTRVGAA
jgi:cytidylate kinase